MLLFALFSIASCVFLPVKGCGELTLMDSSQIIVELRDNGDLHLSLIKRGTPVLQRIVNSEAIPEGQHILIATPYHYTIGIRSSKPRSGFCNSCNHYIVLGPYLIYVSRLIEKGSVTLDIQSATPFLKPFYLKHGFTQIEYYIPSKSPVKLILYDITGRLVSTLVNANVEAGYHSINLDIENLTPGVYFLRFYANGVEHTEKLLLLR